MWKRFLAAGLLVCPVAAVAQPFDARPWLEDLERNAHELVVTQTMRERKALMEARGDAFLTLPGGLGTFEEIFEIIVGKQLGYHSKPIVLLDINRYFDPLLEMIDHGIEQKFIKPRARHLFFVAKTVDEAIAHIRNYQPSKPDDKWFDVPSGKW